MTGLSSMRPHSVCLLRRGNQPAIVVVNRFLFSNARCSTRWQFSAFVLPPVGHRPELPLAAPPADTALGATAVGEGAGRSRYSIEWSTRFVFTSLSS